MNFRKLSAAVVTGAVLSVVGWNVAPAQAPATPWVQTGTTYTLHSNSDGGCPAMDWHIVRGANGTLSGMVGADEMKTVFRIVGQIDKDGVKFHMDGSEVGGPRTGALNGQLQSDGRIAMTIGGLPVGSACQGKTVYIQFRTPYNYTGGTG
jgi:hypothetical protein